MDSYTFYPMKTVDLHLHTTVSDGTDTPRQILNKVSSAGIDLFSVTDHDAIRGSAMIAGLVTEDDPAFITGAEFSCKDDLGKYHILAYGYDPAAGPMNAVVNKGHQLRMEKMYARVDFLKEHFGFTFSSESLEALFALDNPGKPHLGNLMVEYGYAASKEDAIDNYINLKKTENAYVDPGEAIKAILDSGGVPVLAHPSFGSGSQHITGHEMDQRLRHLIGLGLEGVEAFYSGFSRTLIAENLSFADQYHLYVTAGSDYHGKNKPVKLGETHLKPAEAMPDGMIRFLHRVGIYK